MKKNISSFLVGFLFALGLGLSGMTNPHKVLSFLDITGNWDPSLIFVMVGAICVNAVLFYFILKKEKPIYDEKFCLPTKKNIDKKLILGSMLFGIGWGLAGFCPGPAIVTVVSLNNSVITFCLAMLVGAYIYKVINVYWAN